MIYKILRIFLLIVSAGIIFTGCSGNPDIDEPIKVTHITPEDGSVLNTVNTTLVWNPIQGAALYHLLCDTTLEFNSSAASDKYSVETEWTSVNNLEEATWYWKVQAMLANNQWTEWSEPWRFTIDTVMNSNQ